jgi:hypothetical protein
VCGRDPDRAERRTSGQVTRSIWRSVLLVLAHNPELRKRQGIDLANEDITYLHFVFVSLVLIWVKLQK